jgi:predicted PurR-regulated permease PerM
VLAGVFIALFSTYFFLAQGRAIWVWLVRLLPRAAHHRLDVAAQRGWVTLTSFVRATVVVALTDAVGISLGAAVLGVPLVVPLGVLVFLGAFVPVVGALVSGSVAVLIALVAVGPVKALLMLAVVIGVQQLESHVLQPFLLGRAVSVHPLAVILGIAAGALVAGILGALFAVPLIAMGNTMVLSLAGRGDPRPDDDSSPLADDDTSPLADGEPARPAVDNGPGATT